ncbi:hypothetical protein C6A86_006185 [Mycobacterium sp. ITM-2016-00316]|uniref:hypothetical protein n=1 Tax=Mycobacterium sp. ITM-2016-00316 TaxID=2099695 RepID=UPI000CF98617|nr:hypothetical protein [Mycobacterium sp. ITM-2016-00316]WNG83251.1 hypothetical protein C6A86_006185 [Mycobacterium sp. ITM-2016-00316]
MAEQEEDFDMKKTLISAATFITLAVTAFGMASTASAAPSGASATETVEDLRARGYNVQVNGTRSGPLSNCSVDAVRGMSSDAPGSTVYVDLSCSTEYMD